MKKKIDSLFDQIEKSIPFYKRSNKSISKSSIGWQLDHTLKVVILVLEALMETHLEKYKKVFNLNRNILFPLCYIPMRESKSDKGGNAF